jgi:hypothetical protein
MNNPHPNVVELRLSTKYPLEFHLNLLRLSRSHHTGATDWWSDEKMEQVKGRGGEGECRRRRRKKRWEGSQVYRDLIRTGGAREKIRTGSRVRILKYLVVFRYS